jgi:hypothetical protein
MIEQLMKQLSVIQADMEELANSELLTDRQLSDFEQFQQFMFTYCEAIKPPDSKFPFQEPEAHEAWRDWIEHRLSLGRPYRPVALRATLRHLCRISLNNPKLFCAMIDAAIHKGYYDITAGIRAMLDNTNTNEKQAEELVNFDKYME